MQEHGRITSKEYEQLTHISSSVAREELAKLVKKELLQRIGSRGPSVYYTLPAHK